MLYFFEDFVLDPARRELRRGNELIAAQPQVFDLLVYLVTNRDRVVNKDDILHAVWGGRTVSESALTTRINATRTAISDDGDQQRLIRTIPRKGLRFVGVVQEQEKPLDEAAWIPAVVEVETPKRTAASQDTAKSAERRQLTIASCEVLLGAECAGLDPEDVSEKVRSYHGCVVEIARRHNGFVAHTYGNTAVLYLGYPEAHEDDPERAVRAALEVRAAVASLKTPTPLQTRIGIATGLVVVGEMSDAGGVQGRAIIGETPNIAAQLQALAEPNTVVIAENTRKLLGNLFDLQELGTKDLKGIIGTVRAWAALQPSSAASRFEALHGSGLTELVGREEELELLLRRWSRAKVGDGQVMLLSGEPGIGKSRLTAALVEATALEPQIRLRNFCTPHHVDSALYPAIGQMERAAGFARDDSSETKLDKLDALLAQSATSPHDAAVFAELLSVPNDGRYPALELTPQQRRAQTLDALMLQVVTLSQQNPVLIIFEDAQWADPTSLELFSRILDKLPTLRVLLVITYRPEFQPPWLGRPHVTALTINRLAARQAGAMIDHIVAERSLSVSIRTDIIERTDGIPLFIEEMTKAVLEVGNRTAAQYTAAFVPPPAVPASLHASLMARLDRLGSAKRVAQIGAAIGREFSHELLAAVVHQPDSELRLALDRLIEAGLLYRQGVPPRATYLFKHALVQDAAYGTLLREPRRALHASIAEALESRFVEITEARPELLARQYTDAGLIEKAAALWGKAGRRSLERSAAVEAVALFTRALDQLVSLPATSALRREQIKLQIGLANALYHTNGAAAAETIAAFDEARVMIERAEALGEHIEDPLLLYSVLYGFFIAKFINFDGDAASALARRFLALAEQQNATAPIMIGHRLLGNTLLCMGNAVEALSHLDRAWAIYDQATHRPLATRFGHDVGSATLTFRPLALWLLGYPKTALAETERAINAARGTDHIPTLLLALSCTAFTHICCRDPAAAAVHLNECIALAPEKVPYYKMLGGAQRGCVLTQSGKATEAVEAINAEIAGLRAIGAPTWGTSWLSHLALAYAALGQLDDAWRCIGEAMTAVETTKEGWYHAEINRIAGEIALKSLRSDATKAQECFERALSVARQQQAKSWELRAAMSLSRLWCSQGKVQQARELLAPVYGWFTEGFETRDLKDAKVLLAELAS
jgi:DNA-binding winged helix-turn-helix (wHTH) protein/tetratricopeptide (TPR) repeat protein